MLINRSNLNISLSLTKDHLHINIEMYIRFFRYLTARTSKKANSKIMNSQTPDNGKNYLY